MLWLLFNFYMKTKKCTKCLEEKPLTSEFFHRKKYYSDGFQSICKVCRNAYVKKWRNDNKEQIKIIDKKRNKIRYIKNKEEIIKKTTEYQKKNKEKIKITRKTHREKNPKQYKKYSDNQKSNRKKYRDELYDCYVKTQLIKKGFKNEDITDDLIETHKLIIKIKRYEKHQRITGKSN